MKTKTQMKNRLAFTLTLILCFASMAFAKSPGRSVQGAIANPGPLPPTREVNLVIDENSFSVDHIIEPLDYLLSFIF